MIDRERWLQVFTHGVLILGVLIVAFPIYVTFVASTQALQDIIQVPMPLLPGGHLLENYLQAMTGGATSAGNAPVGIIVDVSVDITIDIPVQQYPLGTPKTPEFMGNGVDPPRPRTTKRAATWPPLLFR